MKSVLFVACSLISILSIAQAKKAVVKKAVKPAVSTIPAVKETFSKEVRDSNYIIEDVVKIETGKGEEVNVTFTASVPIEVWDTQLKGTDMKEKEYFSLIAQFLSLHAQYTLKNHLSFEPFAKEFFAWHREQFASSYKMMGKNGYGNAVETSALVTCDPKELKK